MARRPDRAGDSHWQEALVDARLRELAALSANAPSPPPPVDMSAEAVSSRLRECAEISALALELAAAGAAARNERSTP